VKASQAVLRTARELSNRNNNPHLFAAVTVSAFDQNRRMAVAQEQRQREDQLLLLQRQQQQQQQNHGHFATAGNNAVASMGYGVVENDRDRAKAAVVAAFGPELDEEQTVSRTTESSIEMERMMTLRDEQQQKQQQQQSQLQQQQQQQQHQQLQQQLQLQHQQQQLLQRQQQEQVLARAMEERQRQHILEQQVHVQSQLQAQANALQQQSVPELYTVREHDVVIASAGSNFWAENPGNISVRRIRCIRTILNICIICM
jgi:DNA polymerase III alpha subunit (gram-positive type)